jgi:formylglycine-generating enzyme required for sulfatase activity
MKMNYRKVETKKEMTMKRMMALLTAVAISAASSATPTISDLKVTPLSPWGIAVDYDVRGAVSGDEDARLLNVTMAVTGETYVAQTVLGLTNCVNGAHRVYWDMAKDGLAIAATNAFVSVDYNSCHKYCVVDLSAGASASSYKVEYFDSVPSEKFYTNEIYKTTKLVLRRVDAGSFYFRYGTRRTVSFSQPFYMGVYEVTQKQWELVMGTNVCSLTIRGKGDAYPVHYVSYDMIRGSVKGATWPATNAVDGEAEGDVNDSFIGRLRKRTGVLFDLPTEAQWEYTYRAGTTTRYFYGDMENASYMWYDKNSSDGAKTVGTRWPNSWSFYDMAGNVAEWCLDWSGSGLIGTGTYVDPKGPESGSSRVLRGGSWCSGSTTSYDQSSADPSVCDVSSGFRLCGNLH